VPTTTQTERERVAAPRARREADEFRSRHHDAAGERWERAFAMRR